MKRSAYTVIELIITVAIISLLFMLFKYNSSYLEEMRFENACAKIMTDIGYLQNMAINDGGGSRPYIEFDVDGGGYTCYGGDGVILKDPFDRKDMEYQFMSSIDEKNFKNVKLISVVVYYKNGNINVGKIEFNKYGGFKAVEDGSLEEYDNEDNKTSNDWEYLEIVLKNVSPNMNNQDKTIRVEPLTLNMSAD